MKIFVTGGSRGIGANIVKTALAAGHDVAFTYVSSKTAADSLLSAAKSINSQALCRAYQLDVRYSEQVSEVVDQVMDDFGTMDAVVNNAGINYNALACNMSDEAWQSVIDTNLTGAFYVIREFLPVFLANKKGRFIAISSINSGGRPGQASYSASKAGLVGLACTIAKEYGANNITSNVIAPGLFDTDMTRQTMSDSLKDFWMQHCPAKRIGKLEEISALVLFLASEEAGFINGQTINIAGGL